MKHLLENYQLQRFNWAFEAKDDYLGQFKVFETEDKQVDSKRLVISVYGPTQVGKSTLILTLLGVKNEYLREISKFLRGKRDTGESATVTVTIYQISPTDQFQVKLPNKEVETVETEEQLESLLAQLRNDIEEGLIQSVEPVVIAIPKYMFEESEHVLEIIDLPGIESAEQKEVHHVERCINYWIPNSHVCLIVNAANDLTFLRDIEMPQLVHWYDYESNYFLVLTRAITPTSIKKAMQNGEIQSQEQFVGHYKDHIEDILKYRKGTVFPIEIGDSFNKLNETEQQLAKETLSALKTALSSIDIHKISFNYLSGYYRDVLKQQQEELSSLEHQKEDKDQFIVELQGNQESSRKNLESKLANAQEELLILNAQLKIIQSINFNYATYEKKVDNTVNKSEITKSKSGANRQFSNLVASLEDEINEKVKQLNPSLQKLAKELQLKNSKPIELVSIVFSYWDTSRIDKYFSESNYLRQKASMASHLKELLKDVLVDLQNQVSKKQKMLKQLNIDMEQDVKRQEAILKGDQQEYEKMIEKELAEQQALETRLNQVHDMWERDKEHALKYKEYFIKHFLKRKNELYEMAASNNYEQQYLAFLFLQVLGDDAKKIIDSMEIEKHDESKNR